jgi:zinc protease
MRARAWPMLGVAVLVANGCGEPPKPASAPLPVAPALNVPVAPVSLDPLGPAPSVPPPAPFAPPVPDVWKTPTGATVWLLERHTLPYVAITLSVPTGSGSDPKDRGGLAYSTADMLDEGAGARGSLDLARSIDALGATLVTGATLDASTVSLSVLKRNLAPAFGLFADVVARPRMDAIEWKRVHELELNDLTERAADPEEVERVVTRAALFGPDHPYGHPVDGTAISSGAIVLSDVIAFYRRAFRPDRAYLAVVGDVTKAELSALLDRNLGSWKSPATSPPPAVAPDPPKGPWPKLVLVDRSDAPQAVLSLARPGIAAGDPDEPLLERANLTLGGLFTSRLNQDLREEHGYTYGAGSRVSRTRGAGSFVASASVVTEKAADALAALVRDVADYAKGGMTPEEADKTRLQCRSDHVEIFETFDHAAERLAIDAALGLPPETERNAALAAEGASRDTLTKLGAQYFDPASAVVVIVGPKAKLEGPLKAIGYGGFELRDADGKVVKKAPPVGRAL